MTKQCLIIATTVFACLAHGEGARFTSIGDLSRCRATFLPDEERFSVTGQVISVFHRDGRRTVSLTDGESVVSMTDCSAAERGCIGDIVSVSGKVVRNPQLKDNGMTAFALDVVGHARLPAACPVDWSSLFSSQDAISGFISVRGVITSARRDDLDVHWNWLTLRGFAHSMPVAATEEGYPLDGLERLVDAEVELRGYINNVSSVFAKNHLSLLGTNGISVVGRPGDPFAAPPLGRGDPRHRQTVRGEVRAVGAKRLFVQAEASLPMPRDFIAVHLGGDRPDILPGDIVTVSGFRNLASASPQLVNAVVRREGRGAAADEKPIDVAIEDLFTSPLGLRQVRQDWHGKLIRVSGTVVTTPGESSATGVMRLRKGSLTVEVQVSEISESECGDVEEGCVASVTGVCIVELEELDELSAYPIFRRTLVLPRTAGDICVTARRPWWTTRRLIAVIALLCALLSGAMAWNKALKKRARFHAEALFMERMAHARAEVKVEVRTRLAVELHDSISQSLTGIALQLDSAERANQPPNAGVARFLGLARQMLGSCRRELQSCLLDLRSRTFEEKDLSEAIRRTVSPLSEGADVAVRFNVPRERLSDMTVHTILKIIRELVVNAIRHGRAARVRIAGEMEGDEIRFSVRDDGVGFDPLAAPGPGEGHFGLQGIRERIRDFCGDVLVESSPSHGAKVTVTMNATMER